MNEDMMSLSAKFVSLVGRVTWNQIDTKLKVAKEEKNLDAAKARYEEIINELMQDRTELERVAQEYKELYESITISEEDINHLHNTLKEVYGLFTSSKYGINFNEDEDDRSVKLLIDLLNKDTLKTVQMLGFNYKEAIGEPFTEVVSSHILALKKSDSNTKNKKK